MLFPNCGPLPQRSHTFAITSLQNLNLMSLRTPHFSAANRCRQKDRLPECGGVVGNPAKTGDLYRVVLVYTRIQDRYRILSHKQGGPSELLRFHKSMDIAARRKTK